MVYRGKLNQGDSSNIQQQYLSLYQLVVKKLLGFII